MREIEFEYNDRETIMLAKIDSAIVSDGEDPQDALTAAMIDCVATDLMFTAGGVTLHLAAWRDPDHWSEEWTKALGEDADPQAFIAGLVSG